MQDKIIQMILAKVIEHIAQEILTEVMLKKYGDQLFDLIEKVVVDSENKIDDVAVLPMVQKLREILNIK